MFESQFCTLVSITFLVQLFGLITVIVYRLREDGKYNHAGLIAGLLVMGSATLICMPFDAAAGITQGVTLVFVAACTTFRSGETA